MERLKTEFYAMSREFADKIGEISFAVSVLSFAEAAVTVCINLMYHNSQSAREDFVQWEISKNLTLKNKCMELRVQISK